MAGWSDQDIKVGSMRLAVFTKNLTNPAYGAARLGAERAGAQFGAEVLHFVPNKGDDPVEQSALIAQAGRLRPVAGACEQGGPGDPAAFFKTEIAKWNRVIEAAQIKFE
jgi:ABC-type sugar transport system substrate-binding protein